MPVTTPQQLDERYGRRKPRRGVAILGGTAALAVVAVGLWWMGGSSFDSVDANDLAFNLVDEHEIRHSFQITAPRERDVVCVLEALDESKGIVGWKVVEIPGSSEHSRNFTQSIPTLALATTSLVKSCWVS